MIRVGIAGLGTVGLGVVSGLENNDNVKKKSINSKDIKITSVCAKNKKDRGVDLSKYSWFDDPVKLAKSDEIDVFVELIGGANGVAYEAVKAALNSGKSVVTGNKAMLAEHGETLALLAEKVGKEIYFEASIAGGIPIVKIMREALAGNKITKIYGILNGTCNYILSNMVSTKSSFDEMLKKAQEIGYAEADPSFDVDGIDAAQKISILASIAFGVKNYFNSMHIDSISNAVTPSDIELFLKLGYVPKLIGSSAVIDGSLELYMMLALVEKDSIIANVHDAKNCCIVHSDLVGDLSVIGPGAGRYETASSIIADIVDCANNRNSFVFNRPASNLSEIKLRSIDDRVGKYLIIYDPGMTELDDFILNSDIVVDKKTTELNKVCVITESIKEGYIKQLLSKYPVQLFRIEKI